MQETVISGNTVLCLKKGIAFRYEHNFNSGIVILIDTFNDKFWLGNDISAELTLLLKKNKKYTIAEIFSQLLSQYDETLHEQVLEALNNITNDLLAKGFITGIGLQ